MKRKLPELLKRWDRGRVAVVPGKFCNVYLLVSPTAIVMVDPGLPSDSRLAFEFLRSQLGRELTDIKLIMLTHLHADHVAGITFAAAHTGAAVAAGLWTRPLLEGQRIPMPPLRQWLCELLPVWFKLGLPLPSVFDFREGCLTGLPFIKNRLEPPVSIWLQAGDSLPYLSDWQILHMPGHTTDSICILNERQGILATGDLILNFFGTGEFSNIVSNKLDMERSIAYIRTLDLRGILPGHGEPILGNDLADGIVRRSQWGLCDRVF